MLRFLFCMCMVATLCAQSVPPSGPTDPRAVSGLKVYDWTAPLNWPNDATMFLRGDRTWAVVTASGTVTHTSGALTSNADILGNGGADITPMSSLGAATNVLTSQGPGLPPVWSAAGGGATANATVPTFPFLSGANTFSDSPLFRKDANTVEQHNGATNQCSIVYANYTDAANNAGFSICPGNVVTIVQTFKNGTGTIGALQFNVTTGNTGALQIAGSNILRWGSTGISIFGPIINIGTSADATSGQYGVGSIIGSFGLDGHNDATRNDIVCPSLSAEKQAFIVGTFTVNVVQAGATAQTTLNWTDGGNSAVKSIVLPTLDLSLATNQISVAQPIRYKGLTTASFTTTTAAIGAGSYNARIACMATF